MQRFIVPTVLFLLLSAHAFTQNIQHGKTVVLKFEATSIQHNPGQEETLRSITIYLPPGYDQKDRRYPVLYFLHGYTWNDRSTMEGFHLDKLLDTAISNGIIRPLIVVLPDSYTKYKGSFYTNSALTGNWSDYIGKDVVQYIDRYFRSIANRNSRAVAGISMGGNGALKMGMLYANVFSSVYASSPATLNWSDGLNCSLSVFKTISDAKNETAVSKNFPAQLIVDLAKTYTPNINKPPFFADFPAFYKGDSLIIDSAARDNWTKNFVTNMIETHVSALRSLRALKLDWGRDDEARHIPVTCLEFSKKLQWYGIKHFAEQFLGGHDDKFGGIDGRFYVEMLPFFNHYLSF